MWNTLSVEYVYIIVDCNQFYSNFCNRYNGNTSLDSSIVNLFNKDTIHPSTCTNMIQIIISQDEYVYSWTSCPTEKCLHTLTTIPN